MRMYSYKNKVKKIYHNSKNLNGFKDLYSSMCALHVWPGKKYQRNSTTKKVPHAPYSPDLAPSDYHLFRSMEHSLRNMQFANIQHVRKWVGDFVCLQASHVLRYRDPKPTRKMQEHNSYTGGILHWLDFVLFSNKNSKQTIKMTKLFTQPNIWDGVELFKIKETNSHKWDGLLLSWTRSI